jgi:transposase InsO family protein
VDELWVADFSYVWTLTGFVYVAFVVDVFSRRILGWRVSTSKQTPLVTDALHQALTTRRISESRWNAAGLVHHSDAGSQGGFHRSLQHLECGGAWDGTTDWVVDQDDGTTIGAVAGAAGGGAS